MSTDQMLYKIVSWVHAVKYTFCIVQHTSTDEDVLHANADGEETGTQTGKSQWEAFSEIFLQLILTAKFSVFWFDVSSLFLMFQFCTKKWHETHFSMHSMHKWIWQRQGKRVLQTKVQIVKATAA